MLQIKQFYDYIKLVILCLNCYILTFYIKTTFNLSQALHCIVRDLFITYDNIVKQ